MLWIIAIVLALLWALGFITTYTLGGLIHVLLVVTVVLLLIAVIRAATRVDRRRRSRPQPIR